MAPFLISEYAIIENYEPIDKETMKCPDCGDTLDVIEDIKKASCPYCGKDSKTKQIALEQMKVLATMSSEL